MEYLGYVQKSKLCLLQDFERPGFIFAYQTCIRKFHSPSSISHPFPQFAAGTTISLSADDEWQLCFLSRLRTAKLGDNSTGAPTIVWIFIVKYLADHYSPLSCARFPAK